MELLGCLLFGGVFMALFMRAKGIEEKKKKAAKKAMEKEVLSSLLKPFLDVIKE